MKRPLVWFVCFFSLGISCASLIKIPFWLFFLSAAGGLIFCLLSFKKGLRFEIVLLCLVFFLGAARLKSYQTLPSCHIARFISYKNNQPCAIKGFINSSPVFKNNRLSFIFSAEEIQFTDRKYNTCGEILVYLRGKTDLSYAEALVITGSLYRPFKKRKPEQKSFRDYLANQGIYALMNVKAINYVTRLNHKKGFIIKRFALWLKVKIEKIIFKYVSHPSSSILDAMILGDKSNISPVINNLMVKTGTVHILVVSGFNVGIIFFIISLLLKITRIPRKIRIILTIPILVIYCLITGASTPVVRATIMAVTFLTASLFKREPDIYNSSALAGLFIIGINPRQLFDIGFQLSFASVLAIVYLYPKIKSFLKTDSLNRYLRFMIDGSIVSFSAWLGTVGFIAYYFKIISPVTVLANIFIVPLASLITLSGLSMAAAALISPYFARLFASSSELAVMLLIKINTFLAMLPGAYFYL